MQAARELPVKRLILGAGIAARIGIDDLQGAAVGERDGAAVGNDFQPG